MQRLTVILGAGASYDVWNASLVRNEDARPPLARELFNARFWKQREAYPGAITIASALAPLAAHHASAFDLEEQLGRYATSANAQDRWNYGQVPGYLRDVLLFSEQNYVARPANYIHLVQRLLRPRSHEVLFVVLNYDTLLERAIHTYNGSLSFSRLQDYVARDDMKVVKLHGSVDWFVPLPGTARHRGAPVWVEAASQLDTARVSPDRIAVRASSAPTYEVTMPLGGQDVLAYPWLTAPTRGKLPACPDEHRDHMTQFLQGCRKFLVIGTSGLDEDLLGEIGAASGVGQRYRVHYVDELSGSRLKPDGDFISLAADPESEVPARRNFEKVIPAFRERPHGGMARVTVSKRGFGEFLNEDWIESLLDEE